MHSSSFTEPSPDCPLCPRLSSLIAANRVQYPDFFNAPVPAFGSMDAPLLIVGLAPGLKGANRTGRPFTGDFAGDILYAALAEHGFTHGTFKQRVDDGLKLIDCRITNAVRCVPPENKPETEEIKTCNQFLTQEIAAMRNLKVILSLGSISHSAVLRAFGLKLSHAKFTHGAHHRLPNGLILADTYHSSRYNINTGVLTPAMFDEVIHNIRRIL
ncbi:MAG: uracil-DNA glycosylase [Alphaproteobacteria bacterium]|nr:uracil-DNA glycosylase [Alphaproteobacteria bacterium]